jgi:primosomal protein N' (replication factor Y)
MDKLTSPSQYVEVVVDVPTAGQMDTFTYVIPPGMNPTVGDLVRVPFGPRTIRGIIVKFSSKLDAPYVKPIIDISFPYPVISETHLELAKWVSVYYRCSLFEAIAPMLPPGYRSSSRISISLCGDAHGSKGLSERATQLLEYLRTHRRPVRLSLLTRGLGRWVPTALRELNRAGIAQEEWIEPKGVSPSATTEVIHLCLSDQDIEEWIEKHNLRAPKQCAIITWLIDIRPVAPSVVEVRRKFASDAFIRLIRKGILRVDSAPLEPLLVPEAESELLLTGPQSMALEQIRPALAASDIENRVFLLHGVTGSGKTEVYLQALADCLRRGKRALVLVPELSLTPQTLARFSARFPGQTGILNSGLTETQYRESWWDIFAGERPVVIGARSAIFAPQSNLGLIVLDEEHEWTYKQQDAVPRYHARDVALRLARLTGAVVILGSATPDVATCYAAKNGEIKRLFLPFRIEQSGSAIEMPNIRLVDMKEELKSGNRSVLSIDLQQELSRCFDLGDQAVLFLNRRGAASVVECRDCGMVLQCWRCSTSYTFHGGGELICHHCNRRRRMPSACPRCHSHRIRYLGIGTQKLVEEVESLLPGVRVSRWDRDAAHTMKDHEKLLSEFSAGGSDVLVGTQMIAKGLHMPSVTLVGAILADIGLHVPDFRAPERTFQILTQVAGRAGRGSRPGKVIIQTYVPDHFALQAAACNDYDGFYNNVIAHRMTQGDPPIGRLIRLVFRHTDEGMARRESEKLAIRLKQVARQWGISHIDVIGPAPSHPPRLRGIWRWHLLLRGSDPGLLLDKVPLSANWIVDVDPVTTI